MKTIDWPTARDSGHVSTIEERLDQAFPSGSYFLKNPDGSNARSDQGVDTFRKEWAKKQKTTPDAYKKKGTGRQTLTIRTNNSIETTRRNAAEGLGIPPAAIVLRKPDGTQPKLSVKLSTFQGYWSGKR